MDTCGKPGWCKLTALLPGRGYLPQPCPRFWMKEGPFSPHVVPRSLSTAQ